MAEPRNSVEMTQPRSSPARNGNNGAIATEPSVYSHKQFRSDYCHCCNDEHTCWWGFWYCWLLQARTARTFELDASVNQITIYLLFFIGSYFLGIYFIVVGFLLLAVNRAFLRTSLRKKLNINGTLCGDCVLHSCCASCAICQEAREARILHSDTMDLISGEELATQEEFYKRATGHGERGTADQPKEGDKFYNHLRAISNTSKFIGLFSLGIACVATFLLIEQGSGNAIFVTFLIFLQPFLLLYFIYWRTRREYASLDLVIKCFAVGFFMTTFQAVCIELLFQYSMTIFLLSVVIVSGPFVSPTTSSEMASAALGSMSLPSLFQLHKPSSSILVNAMNQLSIIHGALFTSGADNMNYSLASSPTPGVSLALQYGIRQYPYNSESDGVRNLAAGMPTLSPEMTASLQRLIKEYSFVVFLAVFIMAFVIAAGVEETLKHFIVRCCPFTRPIKDPSAVLVYLVAGALGFATFENVEYVFINAGGSQVFSESVLINELFVLLIRVLMPIHVICAVLQAINLSLVVTGKKEMSLFKILLPGILLHGSFDFVLMVLGPLSFVYNVGDVTLEIVGAVLAISLTIIGSVYSYRTFKKIEKDFHTGYGISMDDDEDVPLV